MAPRERKQVDDSTYSGRLALRLRELRDKKKMSAEEVAAKLGVPVRSYYNWEQCRRSIPYDLLPFIAEALGITVRTLLPQK